MQICIGIIKINSISTIGSLNVGKTIICRNEASSSALYPITGPGQSISSEFTIGGTTPSTPASATVASGVLSPPTAPPVI
jgi:hypothetical protein